MSMDKAIASGKEHRKPYYKAKAIAKSCRNHGSCLWCELNRKHKFLDKYICELEDTGCGVDTKEENEEVDWASANVADVSVDGILLDGNYLESLIEEIDEEEYKGA